MSRCWRCVSEDRVLISKDQDFGDLVFLKGERAIGIIRIRFGMSSGAAAVGDETRRRIEALGEAGVRGRFTVLTDDATRQRDLPGVADLR